MTPRQILKTSAPIAIAAAFAALAGPAMADPFDACTDHNWAAFAAAVDSGRAADLEAFLDVTGPNCPLGETATVLLCALDPAACLVPIEPAAGRPGIEIAPERPGTIITATPGGHIGVERDGGDNGGGDGGDNGGGNGGSAGNDNPGNDDPGNDKPGNDRPDNGPDRADAGPGASISAL